MQATRRSFLGGLLAGAAGRLSFAAAEPGLKITSVRVVQTRPRNPLPAYTPAPTSYWVNREAARPISIYRNLPGTTRNWEQAHT